MGDAVSIDGIRAVMEIPDGAVLTEKVPSVKVKAFSDTRIEFGCIEIPANGPQCTQVVSAMEIVDPSL